MQFVKNVERKNELAKKFRHIFCKMVAITTDKAKKYVIIHIKQQRLQVTKLHSFISNIAAHWVSFLNHAS